MAKHRRKKLLARAARADGFSVSTASSPGLFGPQPIPRKAESDDDDESDAGAPAAAPAAASHAAGDGKGSKYYQPSQKTLLVGEGDLSFGAALAVAWGAAENLTATVFDDEATAARKYAAAAENASTLRALGARVLYGVDAVHGKPHGVRKRPEMLGHVDRLYQERNDRIAASLPACRLRPVT